MPAAVSGHGKLWRDGYRLEESMRSPFISEALASRILRAGKSLNFLRSIRHPSNLVCPYDVLLLHPIFAIA